MPIYEYRCGKCGDFEVMQKISDKPLNTCPTCRRKVNKLISSTSFQLKGSGWYVTDYARKGGAGGGADKSSKSDGKQSDTSDSDGSSKASGETAGGGDSSKASGESAGKASSEGSSKSSGDGSSKSSGASKKSSGKAGEKAAAA